MQRRRKVLGDDHPKFILSLRTLKQWEAEDAEASEEAEAAEDIEGVNANVTREVGHQATESSRPIVVEETPRPHKRPRRAYWCL